MLGELAGSSHRDILQQVEALGLQDRVTDQLDAGAIGVVSEVPYPSTGT